MFIDEIETILQNYGVNELENIIYDIFNNEYLEFNNILFDIDFNLNDLIDNTFLESFLGYSSSMNGLEEYLTEKIYYDYNQQLTDRLNIDIEWIILNFEKLELEIIELIISHVNDYFNTDFKVQRNSKYNKNKYCLVFHQSDIINMNYNSMTGTGAYLSEYIELSNNKPVYQMQIITMIYNYIIYYLDEYYTKQEITELTEESMEIVYYYYWYMNLNQLEIYMQDITPVRNHAIKNIYSVIYSSKY